MENVHFALYLLCAASVLFAAHVVRAARWAILFSPHELTKRFHLLLGLALGYSANAVLPWRLGELLRAWFVSRRDSLRLSYVVATVVAERLSDLLVVAVLIGLIRDFDAPPGDELHSLLPELAVGMAILLAAFCMSVQRSALVRRGIWHGASIFNDRLRFSLVDLVWSLSELVVGGALWRRRYLVASVFMWALYLLSYYLFSFVVHGRFDQIVIEMLSTPFQAPVATLLSSDAGHARALAVFAGLPVVGVLAYGLLKQWSRISQLLRARRRYGWYSERPLAGSARTRFKAETEYHYFLASLFSGHNKAASVFGMEAVENATVHKLYGGGSDAITALVETEGGLLIRKFASGDAGAKLRLQQEWLVKHRVADFPLVEVLRGTAKRSAYFYDMPLVVPANDFFDFIHSNPAESSLAILDQVTEKITGLHQRNLQDSAPRATIEKYLREKAIGNARAVLDFARTLLPGGQYEVNGRECHLETWNLLLDPEWLSNQIQLDAATIVHGDLTIENIIVAPHVGPGWYIIDPNPENIFNSPLIDWGKLLQSVHLGYEGLNRNYSCTLEKSSIRMAFTRSQVYTQLHQFIESCLHRRYGERGLREAYFHELVHYLRLVPYKIRQNPHKGLAFFACTSVLLHEYTDRWK